MTPTIRKMSSLCQILATQLCSGLAQSPLKHDTLHLPDSSGLRKGVHLYFYDYTLYQPLQAAHADYDKNMCCVE